MRHAISSRARKLDDFFKRAKKFPADDEVVSDLARLGAILACGYVERCVEVVILERLSKRAHERVLKFVKTHFKRGANYDCESIAQLLERFDINWARNFRTKIAENEQWETSISSLYTVRNSIAHGGDQNLGLAGVSALYEDCKFIVEALIDVTQ